MHRDERQRAAQPPPPGGWPAGSTSPSSPQGLETRSRKRARTDSASSPSADSNGTLGSVVDAQRDIRHVTADSYPGHAPSTYRTWIQGIDPQTAGKPAYTSYIGAKVDQHFETGWDVCVVCCIAADPRQSYRLGLSRGRDRVSVLIESSNHRGLRSVGREMVSTAVVAFQRRSVRCRTRFEPSSTR
jgi:hypothetical protein